MQPGDNRPESPPPGAAPESSELPEPAEALAKITMEALAKSESGWDAMWGKVIESTRALGENFDLFRHAQTIEALRPFARQLRDESKALSTLYLGLGESSEDLEKNLRKAPAYLREVGQLYGHYADEVKTPEVAENYRVLQEFWLAARPR